jgi:hypothetical protein
MLHYIQQEVNGNQIEYTKDFLLLKVADVMLSMNLQRRNEKILNS